MGFYTWKCRGQTNYFHSYASNVRIFIVCVIVVMSWSLFIQLSNTRFQHKCVLSFLFFFLF
jgi:hypothetical protein